MKVRELQQWGGPRSHSRVPRLAAAASQGAERHGAGLYSADGRICKRAFPPFPSSLPASPLPVFHLGWGVICLDLGL